jgi:aminopeptidase N
MRETAEAFADEGPIRLGFRVGHLRNDRRAFRAIIYNKSAVVLHMLRRIVGDAAFVAGLRELITAHGFSVITTGDVERAFSAHTDTRLDRFFTRWIREDGVPSLLLAWSATASVLSVHVEQVGPVFDLPYDLSVELADGRRQSVSLVVTESRQHFTIPVNGPVRRVAADDRQTPARVELRSAAR